MTKVYVSPSLQEHNIGAGDYGTEEYRMNQIADVVVPLLQYNNFTVYRNKPEMSLSQVVSESNSKHVDIHVAIHSNAGGGRGAEVYYTSNNGKILASDLYKYIEPLTPTSDRGVKHTDSLYELNETVAVAALIEVAFHDNRDDANFIINNIDAIGEAIAKGVCDYFNVQFKKPEPPKPPTESTGGLYKVQVGAFSKKENAENLAIELGSQGYDVYVYQVDGLYKVQVGAFKDKSNAEKLASELEAKGYSVYVYQD